MFCTIDNFNSIGANPLKPLEIRKHSILDCAVVEMPFYIDYTLIAECSTSTLLYESLCLYRLEALALEVPNMIKINLHSSTFN